MPKQPRRIKRAPQPKDKTAASARKLGKGVKTQGPGKGVKTQGPVSGTRRKRRK